MPRDRIRAEIREIAADGSFSFACHPGVACFTECCRDLELALSPYDVIRLSRGLGISRALFLERHAMTAVIPEEPLPQVLLAMNEEDGGRCPFVTEAGCRVYADRPAACRAYPLARGTGTAPDGSRTEHYALIHEPHCQGFTDRVKREFSPRSWLADQGLAPYNRANDLMRRLRDLALTRGPLSEEESAAYLRALYLDPLPAAGIEKNGKQGGEETVELLKIRIDEIAQSIFLNP